MLFLIVFFVLFDNRSFNIKHKPTHMFYLIVALGVGLTVSTDLWKSRTDWDIKTTEENLVFDTIPPNSYITGLLRMLHTFYESHGHSCDAALIGLIQSESRHMTKAAGQTPDGLLALTCVQEQQRQQTECSRGEFVHAKTWSFYCLDVHISVWW